ncbi:MAG: zinc-dependent metalloprotease [Myxococcota bacterium]
MLGAVALTVACGGPDAMTPEQETEQIVENLVAAGFPISDIQLYDDDVYVGRDAHVTLEASREMLQPNLDLDLSDIETDGDRSKLEQYSTNNLVSRSLRTICIDGRRLSGRLSTALNWSINNYNRLGLTFQMRRITTNTSGCNALITAFTVGGSGGSAGFPSRGLPYNRINIGSGLASLNTNTVEHVITHELGHCVGFRHSDYFNRSISCGSGGNEGSAGIGANLIPGTPSGASVGASLMNSCFRANQEDGEFTSTDVTALRQLY